MRHDFEIPLAKMNKKAKQLSEKILGKSKSSLFRKILYGTCQGTPKVSPEVVRKIVRLRETHPDIIMTQELQDKVYQAFDRLFMQLAHKAKARFPMISFHDFYYEAQVACFHAINNYADEGIAFCTYLYTCVRQRLLEYANKINRFYRKQINFSSLQKKQFLTITMPEVASLEVKESIENANLTSFQRECLLAYMNGETLTSVGERHGLSRAFAGQEFKTASAKMRRMYA